MSDKTYQVAIIGGGVCGSALLYMLSEYTNVSDVALIEKYGSVATVNSHGRNNSQTIHCGDIETNYTLDKARKVKSAAAMLVNFAKALPDSDQIIFKYPKMVLGIGEKQCRLLRERYQVFRDVFPEAAGKGRYWRCGAK